MASLEHAKTARDCLRFLRKKRLFIPTDVIFIQYLLKNIDCGDLFDKCYRYAEAQKALCYYEKPPGNYMINCYQKLASNILACSFVCTRFDYSCNSYNHKKKTGFILKKTSVSLRYNNTFSIFKV